MVDFALDIKKTFKYKRPIQIEPYRNGAKYFAL
jgi:hypothetical protein